MKIIGLTGGVASGKNFIAEIFAKSGAAIFDADNEVHKLLDSDKSTIAEVQKYFPESLIEKKIDRKILGKIVFADKNKLEILEKILHPKVREQYQKFLKLSQRRRVKLVILNIPLLLEKGGYKCDKIIAIITSKIAQKHRFLNRHKISNSQILEFSKLEEKFYQIKSKQINNLERRKKADFVIFNGLSKGYTMAQVKEILRQVQDD
jgi:dephospho-CoA kinase